MPELRVVGRYVLGQEIATGGMATVYVGWLRGPAGFSRVVAVKRLHPPYAKEPEFVSMFLDEARLAARIRHPNVVSTLDIVHAEGELLLIMEYVCGASLAFLLRECRARNVAVPETIAVAVAVQVLEGLDAAHNARDDHGEALHLVHRDVSPQNILVGADGGVRLADFGIAKAAGRLQTTREGQVKGKSAYMAPEQLRGRDIDRRADVYAVGVVLWEMLVCDRLFVGDSHMETALQVLEKPVTAPHERRPGISPTLSAIVMRALARRTERRFASAIEMARALDAAVRPASTQELRDWVRELAPTVLAQSDEASSCTSWTDVSTIGDSIPSRRRRHVRLITLAISVGLLGVGVALSRGVDNPSAPAPVPAASTVPIVRSEAFEPSPPSSQSSESASPLPSTTSAISSVPTTRRPAPSRKSRQVPSNCEPPFRVDEHGVRIPKPNCF